MIVNEPKFPHTVLQLFMITAKVRLSQFEKILITGSIQTGQFLQIFKGIQVYYGIFQGQILFKFLLTYPTLKFLFF